MISVSSFCLRNNKQLSRIFLSLFILCYLFLAPPLTLAQCATDPNAPSGSTAVECKAAGIVQVQQLVTRMINISVRIAFIALTVWLVWSALKLFITSGGDPKALTHAWHSLTWGFMGIFFLILAYLAIRLVAVVTGADVTGYCFGFPPYCLDQMLPNSSS